MTEPELVLVLGLLGLLLSAQCEVRARDPEEEEGGRGGGGVSESVDTPPTGDRGNDAVRTGYKPLSPVKISTPLLTHTDVQDQHDHTTTHPARDTGHAHNSHHTPHDLDSGHAHHGADRLNPHRGRQHQPRHYPYDDDAAHHYPEFPEMMALVLSQLQPLLHHFNRSVDHLTRQVGDLAREVLQLKGGRLGAELQQQAELQPQAGPTEALQHNEEAEEILDAKLDEVYDHIREVQAQMETHKMDVDNRLQSQHAMLHHNLTSFKMDTDVKLKRQQKTLQISLQAINATLSDLKVDQDHTHAPPPPSMLRPQPLASTDSSTLWDAIERLDNMVVNNTVKVGGLMEDVGVASGNIQRLRFDLKDLEKMINKTARRSQILFMETGLEVEEAKVGVLKEVHQLTHNVTRLTHNVTLLTHNVTRLTHNVTRLTHNVTQLTHNVTQHTEHLQDMDVDMDYLFTVHYQNHSSPDCDCKALTAAVVQLERGVANVTALANENRIALEEDDDGGVEPWGGASDWEAAVEALQHGLHEVRESVVLDQTRTRTRTQSMNLTLEQLSSSVTFSAAEVKGLKEEEEQLKKELQLLSGFFNSLLKDAVRHSSVLELLLGEEVLEFLELPVQEQEANSIPALKEQLRKLQEELRRHSGADREEVPSADQPSSSSSYLLPVNSGEAAQEKQHVLRPESEGDGSDLWNLENLVQELMLKVKQLEDKLCSSTEREVLSKLQEEVMWLKRGLEEHLRLFKNVFTNADVLLKSDAALDLDKVWQLVKNQKTKKDRKRGGGATRGGATGGGATGGGEEPGRRGNHRNRRDLPGGALVSEDSVMFVASLKISNSVVTFDWSLNRGHVHSDTFTAPVGGVYVFILTLDLKSGSAHVVLRKGGGVSVSLNRQNVTAAGGRGGRSTSVGLLRLRKGEEIWLELRGGAWAESEDNVFTGLLLHRTT